VTDRSLRADQLAHARRTNPQTDDLRARIAEALNACPAQFIQDTPDGGGWFKDRPYRRHDQHRYDGGCAMCRGETDTLISAVLAVVQPELDRLAATLAEIDREHTALTRREIAVRDYCTLTLDDPLGLDARQVAQDVLRLLDGATGVAASQAPAKEDGLAVAAPEPDPQPVSADFFTNLHRIRAVETDSLHAWYATTEES
jgi:hypothetical protein